MSALSNEMHGKKSEPFRYLDKMQ